eukprot:PITA_34579
MDVSYDCELKLSTDFEPTSFKEDASHDEWKEAMQKEYDALIKNDTWKLVDPPFRTEPIGCKWVHKNKYKADGSLDKHKVRLVEKGFSQKERVDYEETFSPTAKWATIRTLFSLAAQNGWKVHQMDVKTAFLNGDLKENVFMSQPEGFAVKGHEHKVCKLVKSLYGLKQAPRAWFGMKKCNPLTTLMERNLKLTSIEGKEFEDSTKYRQPVESLNYLTTTRPDISFDVGILSRFIQKPCEGHWSAVKRVLRYLKGTQDFGIKYTQVDDFNLIGYSDSDFYGDKETRVSTSGYAMSLGSGVVSWSSCKQSVPPDSTTEAEYMAAAKATKEIVWFKKILEDLQVKQVQLTPLMIDNTLAIKLGKNPKFDD